MKQFKSIEEFSKAFTSGEFLLEHIIEINKKKDCKHPAAVFDRKITENPQRGRMVDKYRVLCLISILYNTIHCYGFGM